MSDSPKVISSDQMRESAARMKNETDIQEQLYLQLRNAGVRIQDELVFSPGWRGPGVVVNDQLNSHYEAALKQRGRSNTVIDSIIRHANAQDEQNEMASAQMEANGAN